MVTRTKTDPARDAWGAALELFFSNTIHNRMHEVCDALGLSPPAMKALMFLEPGEAKPMRTLASEWCCDASWVTTLVDTLEERDLAERRILPTDRRVKTVALTGLGEKTRAELHDRLHEPPAEMDTLTKAEQRHLADLLKRVIAAQN